MKKHLSLVLFVSLCVLNACSDDDSHESNSVEPTPVPDGTCSSDSYIGTCPTATTYTACADGVIVIRNCPTDLTCENGVCGGTPLPDDCDPDNYISTCADKTHKTVCNSENKVENEACPEGTRCEGGNCVAEDSCSEDTFVPECTDGKHHTVCKDGTKDTEECEEEAICLGGECTTEISCTPGEYVSECQGEKQYTVCNESEQIESADCEGDTICMGGECKEKEECDPLDYIGICVDETHYTACHENGYVKTFECEENTECLSGTCSPKDCTGVGCECDAASFTATCEDDKYVACENGVVTEYNCADDGMVCYQGQCSVVGMVECDANSFVDKCIGDTLVLCSKHGYEKLDNADGYVTYPDLLFAGNCAFAFEERQGICAVVNGIANCYRPCSDKEYEDHASSICGGIDSSVPGGCQESDDHKYIFTIDENAEIQYCTTDETNICKDGKCIKDDKVFTSCDPSTDKSICDGNYLYYCYDDDGYLSEPYFTMDACLLYGAECLEIDGVSDCYLPCETEGDFIYSDVDIPRGKAVRYECTNTDKGMYYIPKPAECYAIFNSEDPSYEDHDYLSNGDICVHDKTDATEGVCDGNVAKNVDLFEYRNENDDWVSDMFEIAIDCGSKTCGVLDGKAFCAETCTAEDESNKQTKHVCSIFNDWKELEYRSLSYSCVQVDDKYFWVNDGGVSCGHGCAEDQTCKQIHSAEAMSCSEVSDSEFKDDGYQCDNNIFLYCYDGSVQAYNCGNQVCAKLEDTRGCFDTCAESDVGNTTDVCEDDRSSIHRECVQSSDGKSVLLDSLQYCYHGCDTANGQCIKLHEDEGKECDPDDTYRKCAGDVILRCEASSNGKFAWFAESCADFEYSPDAPSKEGTCIVDGSNPMCALKCSAADMASSKGECKEGYLSGWVCRQSGDTYFWDNSGLFCNHGCNDEGTDCLMIHPDEGKACSEDEYGKSKCADADIMLSCYGTYEAESCEAKGAVCVETSDGAECSDVCTQAEAEAETVKVACNVKYLENYKCMDLGGGDYHWSEASYLLCEHGCDNEKKSCVTIHADEYQACATKDSDGYDVPAEPRCDGKIFLSCDYDYGQESYLYHASQCDAECDAEVGCYEACTTVGTTTVCEDSEFVKIEKCIESEVNHIKYKTTDVTRCDHGCDTAKNECVKIHAEEGKKCSTYDESPDYYANKCDGKIQLFCYDDEVVAVDCEDNSCHEVLGCYIPCTTAAETVYVCTDSETSSEAVCYENTEYNIKYLSDFDNTYCSGGCDSSTGKCK
ncbi:MAG: hypothetical protein J6A01_05715 [Proteobacteria bacterium]|nr:hypothetical protein [Pseudomonadota bacterium]